MPSDKAQPPLHTLKGIKGQAPLNIPHRAQAKMRAHPSKQTSGHPKGQASIMEYLLLSFFILMVIIALILFLTFWQTSSLNLEKQNLKIQRLDTLLNRFINSPLFVKENSVFDDSKLMAIQSLESQGACHDLEGLFGSDWSIEVEVLTPRPGCAGPCTVSSYPCCGSWEICTRGEKNVTRVLPVNVYRKAEDRNDLGLLTVGVYDID